MLQYYGNERDRNFITYKCCSISLKLLCKFNIITPQHTHIHTHTYKEDFFSIYERMRAKESARWNKIMSAVSARVRQTYASLWVYCCNGFRKYGNEIFFYDVFVVEWASERAKDERI